MAEASPLVRYAAFIRDDLDRRRSAGAEAIDDELGRLLRSEGLRLRTGDPDAWEAAGALLRSAAEPADQPDRGAKSGRMTRPIVTFCMAVADCPDRSSA